MIKFLTAIFLFLTVSTLTAVPNSASPELLSDLINRRAQVAKSLADNSILIVFSAPERPHSGDTSYEYRQANNLYYLTGITQEDTVLVLMPGNKERSEFLFAKDRNPSAEVWTGHILSHEEITAISGIKNVFGREQLDAFLLSILDRDQIRFGTYKYAPSHEYDSFLDAVEAGKASIYFAFETKPGLGDPLTPEFEYANKLRERTAGVTIRDAWPAMKNLRQVKSAYEIKMLRETIDITGEALEHAITTAKPGMWEYEVEAGIEEVYKRRNAFDWAFPSIVASGPNSTTLHYESGQRKIQNGDLLLMDVGSEYAFYSADITRTIPANGKFSKEQADIYQIVLDAQEAALKAIRPGATLPDSHLKGTEVVKAGLKRLGLITDENSEQYRIWFMHGVGHWLGMDTHDAGERWRPLQPGMVITDEPGIYIRADALDNMPDTPENAKFKTAVRPAFEKYKNIGVRIEDDVLVTADGNELLSKRAPRTMEAIEQLMKK